MPKPMTTIQRFTQHYRPESLRAERSAYRSAYVAAALLACFWVAALLHHMGAITE